MLQRTFRGFTVPRPDSALLNHRPPSSFP
jgi:hypothetical protein